MYAAMRATVPGVKIYWHKKGMFIQGEDESEDVSVICDDNLIEHLAYWRDKKKLLIKTSRLGYWQAWCPRWSCHSPPTLTTSYTAVSSSPPDDKPNCDNLQHRMS